MSRTPDRRRDIDIARGIAVLLMIEAHTTDAWTRAVSKATAAYRDTVVLGGFAAPLFLWLADNTTPTPANQRNSGAAKPPSTTVSR